MRRLLFLLLIGLSASCYAVGGPIYQNKDPDTQREFQNIYGFLTNGNFESVKVGTDTVAYLNVSTITVNGKTVSLTTNSCGYLSGTVVQSSQAVTTGQKTTTSTSYVNSTLAITITPKCATDVIFLLVQGNGGAGQGDAYFTIANGSTNLAKNGGTNYMAEIVNLNSASDGATVGIEWTDSPNSVSAQTYHLQLLTTNAGFTASFPTTAGQQTQMLAWEISQ